MGNAALKNNSVAPIQGGESSSVGEYFRSVKKTLSIANTSKDFVGFLKGSNMADFTSSLTV